MVYLLSNVGNRIVENGYYRECVLLVWFLLALLLAFLFAFLSAFLKAWPCLFLLACSS